MKASLFFLLILLSQPILSQGTYYKLYSNEFRNIIEDIEIYKNNMYISSLGLVKEDSNLYSFITNLSKINLEDGNKIKTAPKSKLLPDYYGKYSFNRLSKLGDNFIVSGHEVGKEYETKFHIFNPDLEDQKDFSITSTNAERIGNEGIYVEDSILYSYGLLQKEEVLYANILKYNLNTNTIIWDKNYKKGKRLNQMWDFQKTHDGNFVFIMYHKDADAGSGSNSGYQIIKINPNGTILDTFDHKDLGADKQRILETNEGAIYYTTEDNPLAPIIPTNGRINKLSRNMDTILWSLELPSNAFTNGNRYEIFDYIQSSKGDIMACGKVWHMPGGPLLAGLNATWNGFAARVTQDGELKWLRIYRLPNDNPKLPKENYGNFRPGQLDKILEAEDGNFVLGGTAFYNSTQLGGLEFGDTLSSMWIMVVDENGCMEGEECDEVIHLNEKKEINFNIGDQWTYEEVQYFGGGNSEIRYKSYIIQDTFFEGGQTKFIIDIQDTFYIEDNKMYFWDEHYNEYIKYYDFEATTTYEVKYFDPFRQSDEIATIVVDSISYKYFGKDSLKIQHVHILNSGTLEEYHEEVFEGISAGHFGIKFLLGCGLCDFNPSITKLRCFSNEEMSYNFVDYACDSIWLSTKTSEINIEDFLIYPNPNVGIVNIQGLNNEVPYEIFTSSGKLFKKGMTKNYSLSIDEKGFYILRFYINGVWISKKIVKIE